MFQTNPKDLKDALQEVQEGKIQLPDFQRDWRWDDDHICGLLASISRDFPIGAIMTLSAGGDIDFKTRLIQGVESSSIATPQYFLLDGQQRLTSLYQSLVRSAPVETKDSRGKQLRQWYYIDMLKAMDRDADREEAIVSVPANKKVTRNFGREVARDLSTPDLEYQNHMMPANKLLDSRRWTHEYERFWNSRGDHPSGDVVSFMDEFDKSVIDAFVRYELPVINLDKDTPKEAVCTVFEKVNTGGVVLTVFELVTASFAADAGVEHFSLREDWEARRKRLHSFSGVLQVIGGDQFLQAVALLTTQERRRKALADGQPASQSPGIRCTRDAILRLSLKDYQDWADKVESGFNEAAKFLNRQYVFTKWDVPYGTQLVPLAVLFAELGRELEPAVAKSRLERWYWCGVLGETYGSAVESQFSLDLVEVAEYVRRGTEPVSVTTANFDPARLLYLRTRRSAAYKGIYALQMKSGAADWRTADPLTQATWHGQNIDVHHIFPVSWCRQQNPPVPSNLYDSVINKTPIDAYTNRTIGGRAPSAYLSRLEREDISPETLNQVLQAHWLNPDTLRADKFAESFVQRGEAIMELIGKAMGKSLPSGREVFQNALYLAGLWEPVELTEPVDEYEDSDEEFDPVGSLVFEEERAAAD